jgi:5-formyltetrahydrofolate cyclo-ligase
MLRELGHPPVPVATTVHDLQIVDSVPRDPYRLDAPQPRGP